MSPPPPSYAAYQHLCALLESQPAHLAKTATIKLALPKWDSQLELLIRMLLPASDQRTFRLQDRGLIKVLSRVYGADADEMRQHMEQCGDVSETAAAFYPGNATGAPNAVVPLGLADVDGVLNELARVSRQDAQAAILGRFVQTTDGASDVKWLCRLLKKDLKTRAKEKLVLSALHPGAYDAFKNRSDILAVVAWARSQPPHFTSSADDAVGATTSMADNTTTVTPGQPVKPMLARPCNELACPFEKFSSFSAEIKYDGERVQIHKTGDKLLYFSRSLKPVPGHKIADLEEYIQRACAGGGGTGAAPVRSAIFDAEILLVDATGRMLPFGTLGVHKRSEFEDANVCIFIFDLLYLNGRALVHEPLRVRRATLEQNIVPVPNRVQLSEQYCSFGSMSTLASVHDLLSLNVHLPAACPSDGAFARICPPFYATSALICPQSDAKSVQA